MRSTHTTTLTPDALQTALRAGREARARAASDALNRLTRLFRAPARPDEAARSRPTSRSTQTAG